MSRYLKNTSALILFIFSIGQSATSQNAIKNSLQGEWVKSKITLIDGSPIYNEGLENSSFGLEFSGDSLIISIDGKNSYSSYDVKDSTLNYRDNYFKILRLDKPFLEVSQVLTSDDVEPIKIEMYFKPTLDIGIIPESYLAKNGDPVYLLRPNQLEPKFINSRYTAIDYINTHFRYPEFKKGGFVVRFVITKTGELEGQRIIASSNQKYDQRLIEAVNKTKGKWLPAKYLGEAVNCEVEFNFDLGYTKPDYSSGNTEEDKKAMAEEYASNGKYYFSAKNYRSAIFYLSKAIENDPYQVSSYYLRAAAYIYNKKPDDACADYLQLKNLGQKRAEGLYDKYCQNYKPETKP